MKREIQVLKDNPHLTLSMIGKRIGVDASILGELQREYYKPFLKRDSPLWGKEGESVLGSTKLEK